MGGCADADADDLLAMLRTWRAAPAAPPDLGDVTARVVLAPCDTDRYFRVDELERREAVALRDAVLRPLSSPYGHRAGDPWGPEMTREREWLCGEMGRFVAEAC